MELREQGARADAEVTVPVAKVRHVDVPVGARQHRGANDQATDVAGSTPAVGTELGRGLDPHSPIHLEGRFVDDGPCCSTRPRGRQRVDLRPDRHAGAGRKAEGDASGARPRLDI